MANTYATREQVKRAALISGDERDAVIDRVLAAASRRIEQETRRWFYPKIETRLYRWPRPEPGLAYRLWLDADLIAVTTLKTKAQDTTPTTIAAADYFVEPANHGPPYTHIEIDQSSTAAFEAGDTPQRSISVLGRWGYGEDTETAGTVSSGLATDATATSMVISDASKIGVGDHLLIESEQVFVSGRSFAALGAILLNMVGNLAADKAVITVTVDATHGIVAGEVIRIDSEQMYVEAVNGNDLIVTRSYNATVLTSHNDNTAIHINRTLTIGRAVNGTTAATHANATAISRYVVPEDINGWCIAEALAAYHQEQAGWGREIGTGEGARELSGRALGDLRASMRETYRRLRMAAV